MDFVPYIFFWHLSISAILILCTISCIIGNYSKEKSFLLYSFYSFFLFVFLVRESPYDIGIQKFLIQNNVIQLHWYLQVIYNCAYFLFFVTFLDIKKFQPKFYKWITQFVATSFSLGTLTLLYSFIAGDSDFYRYFFIYLFTPIMFLLALYTVYRALKLPGNLKYFICIGSLSYIVLAVMALIFALSGIASVNTALFLFYLGILIENLVFALGLAYKVKVINQARLFQINENQKIKNEQHELLSQALRAKEHEVLQLTAKAEEERIAKIKTEFEGELHQLHLTSLQSQMNPHFIFNALTSIKVFLIENDKAQAIYYLNKFSKLIRKILESSRIETVTLAEELEIIKLYVGIENIRFSEALHFKIEVGDAVDISRIKMPPLILQPFVENALWHGLMPKDGKKSLTIFLKKNQNSTILEIQDNGIGRDASQKNRMQKAFKKDSLGLSLSNERLKYFNKKQGLDYFFEIKDLKNTENQSEGTQVVFYLNETK
ncbi:histidine kinase [Aequorivita echinoideorum]|uniref:Histidine kinase n=1 Tax=Aequorivita echinoideorum TaxID=1549647 RepID=A0ABS5S0H6_9FLAO|nr:histidine kinase [Aequorivita echinoideorum]MBT0606707.1 histidine kinase [Aequorivita echinoideorum]